MNVIPQLSPVEHWSNFLTYEDGKHIAFFRLGFLILYAVDLHLGICGLSSSQEMTLTRSTGHHTR